MEKFIAEHPAFVYLVFLSLAGLTCWLAKMLVKDAINKIKEHKLELEAVKIRTDEIVDNYVSEFKLVRSQANDHKLEILGELTEMKIDIKSVTDAVMTQTKICSLIQEQKHK